MPAAIHSSLAAAIHVTRPVEQGIAARSPGEHDPVGAGPSGLSHGGADRTRVAIADRIVDGGERPGVGAAEREQVDHLARVVPPRL